jgi:hypothetical protein
MTATVFGYRYGLYYGLCIDGWNGHNGTEDYDEQNLILKKEWQCYNVSFDQTEDYSVLIGITKLFGLKKR